MLTHQKEQRITNCPLNHIFVWAADTFVF